MKKHIFRGLLILTVIYSCNKNNTIIKSEKVDGKYLELDSKENKLKEGYMINGLKRGIWKNYENNTLVSFQKFMNDTIEFELDKDDYLYEEVYLEKINSYVPIPKNWDTNSNFEDDQKLLLTSVKNCEDTRDYCPNIIFNYESIEGVSFKEYVENDKNALFESFPDMKEISFDKNKGKYESYLSKHLYKVNGVEISGLLIWFNFDDKVVIFSGSSEKRDINKYLLLFIELGNSITKK